MANQEIDDLLGDLLPGAGGPKVEEGENGDAEETQEETQEAATETEAEEAPTEELEGEAEETTEPSEPAELTKPVAKEAPVVKEPAEEAPAEVAEDETTVLRGQVAALMEQINLLAQGIQPKVEKPVEAPVVETPAAAPAAAPAATPKGFSLFEGLPGDSPEERFASMISSPKAFEQTMAKMAKFIQDVTYGNILRTLPTTVTQLVQSSTSVTEMVSNFYKENSDLAQVKPYVRTVLDGLAAQHPEWEISKLFDETAKNARKALGLKGAKLPGSSSAAKPGPAPKKLPAFAKGRGANQRGGGGAASGGLLKEINDLLS